MPRGGDVGEDKHRITLIARSNVEGVAFGSGSVLGLGEACESSNKRCN
jgi:hypothetical protein